MNLKGIFYFCFYSAIFFLKQYNLQIMNRSLILTSVYIASFCLFVGLDLLYTHDQFVIGVILVVIGLANLVRMIQLLGR